MLIAIKSLFMVVVFAGSALGLHFLITFLYYFSFFLFSFSFLLLFPFVPAHCRTRGISVVVTGSRGVTVGGYALCGKYRSPVMLLQR